MLRLQQPLTRVMEGTYPARPVGFVRIVIGGAALLRGLEAVRILVPLTREEIVNIAYVGWIPRPTGLLVGVLLAIWFLAAAAFTLGVHTQVAGAFLTLAMGLSLLIDQQAYSNHLYLLTVLVALLTIADAGSALSLDAHRNREVERVVRWPVVLMKVQISVVYGFAALTKLNAGFLGGSVLGYHIGRGLIPVSLDWMPRVGFIALAVTVVIVEASLAVLLWLPGSRRVALGLGTVLHLSIPLLMAPALQLVVFSMVMLTSYLLFLEVEPHSRTLVWERRCSESSRWRRLIERLDVLRGVRVVERDPAGLGLSAGHTIHVVVEGETTEGYDALVAAIGITPLGFLAAPFLEEPAVRSIGRRRFDERLAGHGCRAGGRVFGDDHHLSPRNPAET